MTNSSSYLDFPTPLSPTIKIFSVVRTSFSISEIKDDVPNQLLNSEGIDLCWIRPKFPAKISHFVIVIFLDLSSIDTSFISAENRWLLREKPPKRTEKVHGWALRLHSPLHRSSYPFYFDIFSKFPVEVTSMQFISLFIIASILHAWFIWMVHQYKTVWLVDRGWQNSPLHFVTKKTGKRSMIPTSSQGAEES